MEINSVQYLLVKSSLMLIYLLEIHSYRNDTHHELFLDHLWNQQERFKLYLVYGEVVH